MASQRAREFRPTISNIVDDMTPDEVRAWAAQLYPQASIRLITGEEFWFSDLIAEAERRHRL